MFLLERLLVLFTEIHNVGHIDFIERGLKSARILRVLEALRNSLTHSVHFDSLLCSLTYTKMFKNGWFLPHLDYYRRLTFLNISRATGAAATGSGFFATGFTTGVSTLTGSATAGAAPKSAAGAGAAASSPISAPFATTYRAFNLE